MEDLQASHHFLLPIISLLGVLVISIHGQQVTTPCTPSMVTNFTPCFNFITGSSSGNSSSNPSTPTSTCCNALQSLSGTSMDCACLLLTANVPLQLPINRTLALTLPRACNMASVPLQCKAAGSPLPAPGPVLLGPTLSPTASSPFSPQASKAVVVAPTLAPETTVHLTPTSPPVESEAPAASRIRPIITPSSTSNRLNIFSSFIVLLIMVTMNFVFS